ncbi:hypothetical protein [Streptomyces sp. NPDC057557]|uniref:hypothetical protein n=1 Tax=Streptomyces sp. NPDC057557 TaxID=3346167 RepID=UPI00369148D3
MPEYTPNAKGPAKVQLTPEATEPPLIPADQVKPEDIGTLAIEYRDGQPVVVVSGGNTLPSGIRVESESGSTVAIYEAAPATHARKNAEPWLAMLVFASGELPSDPDQLG